MKFKIGDKVKVIKHSTRNCGISRAITCCEQFIGKIGIICSITGGDFGVDKFPETGKWCSGFSEDCLELVKKEIKEYGVVKFLRELEK